MLFILKLLILSTEGHTVGRPAILLPYGNRGPLELPYTKNSPEEKNNDLVHFYVLLIFFKF